MKATIVAVAIITSLAASLLLCAHHPEFVNLLIGKGVFPRLIAWSCLIFGAYGFARSRFSYMVSILFFSIAFFFAYIGVHVPLVRSFY
jgi:hypothetical protein